MDEKNINGKKNFLLITLLAYSIAWVITGVISYWCWGAYLPKADAAGCFLAFLLPLILVGTAAYWSMGHADTFRWAQFFLIILFLFVFANTFFFHRPLMNYGDNGFLSNVVRAEKVYPRWMLGSSILKSSYVSWLSPLVNRNILPPISTADVFVRLSGCLVMIGFTCLMIKRYPNRLTILLPLSTPIWVLLSSGYNEYYPFIAPVYMCILFLFFEWKIEKIKPVYMGLILSSVGLLYAGFLPICLFILLLYTIRTGLKSAFYACVFSTGWVILLIMLFWPGSMPNFIKNYIAVLNLGDKNSPASEIGKAIQGTPFYKTQFATSWDNGKRLFFMLFWGGGLSPLILLLGAVYLLFKKRQIDIIKKLLLMSMFLGYQIFFFIYKIPKLGLRDIDLYFPVYLTFAFIAGFLFDELIKVSSQRNQLFYRIIPYSIVAGNTGFVLLYLLFFGIPIPK